MNVEYNREFKNGLYEGKEIRNKRYEDDFKEGKLMNMELDILKVILKEMKELGKKEKFLEMELNIILMAINILKVNLMKINIVEKDNCMKKMDN